MLAFVAVWPQIVLGSSASRSLASLGRLKLGSARLGSAADDSAALGSAADGAAWDGAAWDGAAAPVEGIGVAAAPQPQSAVSRTPLASAAIVCRRAIEGPPERAW